jgi:predicted PurR-regulated permease PerM
LRDDDRKQPRPLVTLFLLAVALIAAVALPIWRPLLLAAVIAGPLGGWHDRLARRLGGRRTISAALFTLSVGVLVLLPLGAAVFFLGEQAVELAGVVRSTFASKGLPGLLQPLPDELEHWITHRYRDLSQLHVWSSTGKVLGTAMMVMSALSHLAFGSVMFAIALFFLFRDGHALVAWLRLQILIVLLLRASLTTADPRPLRANRKAAIALGSGS